MYLHVPVTAWYVQLLWYLNVRDPEVQEGVGYLALCTNRSHIVSISSHSGMRARAVWIQNHKP